VLKNETSEELDASYKTRRENMKSFDATTIDHNHVRCAVCEENVAGQKCLSCVQHDDRLMVVCGPLCEAVFGLNPVGYVRRIAQTFSLRTSLQS
jgi:hypothetical protein